MVAPNFSCQPKVLARVLFVVGHVAFQQLANLDGSVLSELKRRHRIQEDEKEKKQGGKGANKDNHLGNDETAKVRENAYMKSLSYYHILTFFKGYDL